MGAQNYALNMGVSPFFYPCFLCSMMILELLKIECLLWNNPTSHGCTPSCYRICFKAADKFGVVREKNPDNRFPIVTETLRRYGDWFGQGLLFKTSKFTKIRNICKNTFTIISFQILKWEALGATLQYRNAMAEIRINSEKRN
jgi:hypothetical protein